ncbi:MAG: prepilin-type N-terminal cleavage/methylation domain-containing protein [Acidobacteriota bacterium]
MRMVRVQRGFTLMEILVAFVVLAAAVGVLYRTFSAGLRNVDAVAGYSEAIAIAEAKLAGLGLERPLEEGDESGATEDRRFNWRIAVRPYTPSGSSPDQPGGFISPHQLLRATVTVTWNERGTQKRTVELSTMHMLGKHPT